MQFSSGEDARSVDMVSRLLGSAGDHRDSLTADESDRSRMEEYQDEVRRITDAIADSGWYADDELMNEDDYGTGDLMTIILQSVNIIIFIIIVVVVVVVVIYLCNNGWWRTSL